MCVPVWSSSELGTSASAAEPGRGREQACQRIAVLEGAPVHGGAGSVGPCRGWLQWVGRERGHELTESRGWSVGRGFALGWVGKVGCALAGTGDFFDSLRGGPGVFWIHDAVGRVDEDLERCGTELLAKVLS